MSIKYCIFGSDSVYWNICFADFKKNPEAFVFGGFKNNIGNKLYKLHFSNKLNKVISLPLKSIWYKKVLPTSFADGKVYFIFYEACHLSYSTDFLGYLKKKFPGAKCIYSFSNPPSDFNTSRLSKVRKYYDLVVTFSRDYLRENWVSWENGMYSKVEIPESNFPKSDLFFVGADKGRFDMLLSIYDRLENIGINCNFYITHVPGEKQVERKGIVYDHYLKYSECLELIKNTKCILEILEGNYSSLRTFEAITYNKKLISTNKLLAQSKYYVPDNMRIIQDVNDIDSNWICVQPIDYRIDSTDYSPNRFLDYIYLTLY